MTSLFQKKEITPPKRVCLCLKEARERKGISLEEMSLRTRMSKSQLAALEDCRFQDLPFAPVYQKHLIKAYMASLGMDAAGFVAQFDTEEAPVKKHLPLAIRTPSFSRFLSLPLVLRVGAVICITIGCITYLGFQVKGILEPPELTIYSPQQGYILNTPNLRVTGKTDPEVRVLINGTKVMQGESGDFSANLNLTTGVNTIVISAQRKHGKITTATRHVVVREQKQFSLTSDTAQNTL